MGGRVVAGEQSRGGEGGEDKRRLRLSGGREIQKRENNTTALSCVLGEGGKL